MGVSHRPYKPNPLKMIDTHVHCRDWNQSHKETIEHALKVAEHAGISAIFDMPNTDPPITSKDLVVRRLRDAEKVQTPVFYGLYIGLTSSRNQLEEAVSCYREFFPKVVGFKMYAGHSVGELAIPNEEDQRLVYKVLSELDYQGVLSVHCEKESLMRPNLWNPASPITHGVARPPGAEMTSIDDQIRFAIEEGFHGNLHITHISTPSAVDLVEKNRSKLRISCGVTPHHCVLSTVDMTLSYRPILYKVNPPLRDIETVKIMLEYLKKGKIDLVETDHAPHKLDEKISAPFMSGFPGLPFLPHFVRFLRANGFSREAILNLIHNNASRIFGIDVPFLDTKPDLNLHTEYEVDVYSEIRKRIKK